MKIKKAYKKYYCKIYLTFDEATYLKDYISDKEKQSATGQIKSKLEKLIEWKR